MPKTTKPTTIEPLLQTVAESDGTQTLGQLTWHIPDPAEGIMQILNIKVTPSAQRQGIGSKLLVAATRNAATACKSRNGQLRRVWVALGHQQHILARAFFTRHGYHHVHTLKDLMRSQDLLTYVKSYD